MKFEGKKKRVLRNSTFRKLQKKSQAIELQKMLLSTSTHQASISKDTHMKTFTLPHINLKVDETNNKKIESKEIKLDENIKKQISKDIDTKFRNSSVFSNIGNSNEIKKFKFLKPIQSKNK